MKSALLGTLSVLFFAASMASAQTTPPVKMGLWQSTETTLISGFSLPPQVAAELKRLGRSLPDQTPHTAVYESCLTPTSWQKQLGLANPPHNQDCVTSNRKSSASETSFDITCKGRTYTATGHWDVTFPDREHMHGVGKMSGGATAPGAQPISTNTTFDSHFVSASCGDVQPGSSKILSEN